MLKNKLKPTGLQGLESGVLLLDLLKRGKENHAGVGVRGILVKISLSNTVLLVFRWLTC